MGKGNGGTLLAGEVYAEARDYGLNNGYDIGLDNCLNYSADEKEAYMAECLAAESEHFRQISPFDRFAAMLNSQKDFVRDRAWEIYDKWVARGLEEAWETYLEIADEPEK